MNNAVMNTVRIRSGLILAVLLITALAQPVGADVKIQQWRTANGLTVFFVPMETLPIIDLRLMFDAGSARDGEHPGLAHLTANALEEGTGSLNADTVAVRFADVGAEYVAEADRDKVTLSLRSLNDLKLFDPALETFIGISAHPAFPEPDLERLKQQILVTLRQQEQDPSEVASKTFYQAIYPEHPFAHSITGTPEAVPLLTQADLKRFHEQFYVAQNGVLAIVGDISREQAQAIAERIATGFTPGAKAASLPKAPVLEESRRIEIAFPSAQVHLHLGQPGVARGDPDYFSLYVGNHILGGGGFTSRLVREIRVARGLSYSVYSYFLPLEVEGPFIVGLQTRVDQAAEATRLAREVLRRFVEEGPTEAEIEAAVKNITGGFPLRIDSNNDIAAYVAMIGFYDLPLDYLNTFNDQIKAVTRAAIVDAFRRHLNVNTLVTVEVGGEAST